MSRLRLSFFRMTMLICASTGMTLSPRITAAQSVTSSNTLRGPAIFNSPRDYQVGKEPGPLVVADFNRDGKLDIATANQAAGNVSVLLGSGSGRFGNAIASPVGGGSYPVAMKAGDLNGDRTPDLVMANGFTNLTLILGNGDGTFKPPTKLQLESKPSSVEIADLNDDGNTDIITTLSETDHVAIFFGNGDGSFQEPIYINVGSSPLSVAAADFNGDGNLDLEIAESGSDQVCLLLGNGAGDFGTPVQFSSGGTLPTFLALGDFNSDGATDVAVQNGTFPYASFAVLLNNGSGSLQPAIANATSYLVFTPIVLADDINNDGKMDILVEGTVGNSFDGFLLFTGNGDGTFGGPIGIPLTSGSAGIAVGDFNGDGKLDVASSVTLYGNMVQVRMTLATVSFRRPETIRQLAGQPFMLSRPISTKTAFWI